MRRPSSLSGSRLEMAAPSEPHWRRGPPPECHVRGHAVAQMLPLGEPRLRDLASDQNLGIQRETRPA